MRFAFLRGTVLILTVGSAADGTSALSASAAPAGESRRGLSIRPSVRESCRRRSLGCPAAHLAIPQLPGRPAAIGLCSPRSTPPSRPDLVCASHRSPPSCQPGQAGGFVEHRRSDQLTGGACSTARLRPAHNTRPERRRHSLALHSSVLPAHAMCSCPDPACGSRPRMAMTDEVYASYMSRMRWVAQVIHAG